MWRPDLGRSRNTACLLGLGGLTGTRDRRAAEAAVSAGAHELEEQMAEIKLQPDTERGVAWWVWLLILIAVIVAVWLLIVR